MSGWPPAPADQRTCPGGGLVRIERRWDQPGWYVTCTEHGTLGAGLTPFDARARAGRHLKGDDEGLQS